MRISKKQKQGQSYQRPVRGREVLRVIQALATSDGAGVKLKRSLGSPQLSDLDPFLLLDEFKSDRAGDYIAGFPDHPHRGFETVTYMLAGDMQHQDSTGRTGNLTAGSVQWMTAGHGIIHSEMPQQVDGLLWGFQLWVNLPAALKMEAPRYQDISPDEVPALELGDAGRIRFIAGRSSGIEGPVRGIHTKPLFLDIQLTQASGFTQDLADGHNAFVYVFEGEAIFGISHKHLRAGQLGVLSRNGTELKITTETSGVRFLLLAGQPIGEPIARHGPFVMNTREELLQAFTDYRNGRFTR